MVLLNYALIKYKDDILAVCELMDELTQSKFYTVKKVNPNNYTFTVANITVFVEGKICITVTGAVVII